MAVKIASDGRVTIPQGILDHLGIGPGGEIDFRRAADGSIVLEKAGANAIQDPDRFVKLRGDAGPGLSTDEIMAMTRGE